MSITPDFDPTRIDLFGSGDPTDPRTARISGLTAHQNLSFDAPYLSHITGNLFVGGCEDGLVLPEDIAHVISLYPWEAYTAYHAVDTWVAVRMYDSHDEPDLAQLDAIAAVAAHCIDTGPTLIHCQAGLNRSNLVAGYTLITRFGHAPADAIALLRAKRCAAVLCNTTFERFLLGLEPSVA
jgi:hypothetical protein